MSDTAGNSTELRNDFVATGYVLNPARTKMLLIKHKKLGKWMPPGGHMEPNELPHACVLREVREETGVAAELLSHGTQLGLNDANELQLPTPYCILHEVIPATSDDVEHMHVDFLYLLTAREGALSPRLKEVSGAQWFAKDDIIAADTFPAVRAVAKIILDA